MDLIRNTWDEHAFKPKEVHLNGVQPQELIIHMNIIIASM